MNSITNRLKKYEMIYQGEEVTATDLNKSFQGILEKIEDGFVYLRPSIVFENLAGNKKGEWEYNPVWNEEIPTTFPLTLNTGFQAHSKGYLKKVVESYDKWKEGSKLLSK
jgi:hypothetical protein